MTWSEPWVDVWEVTISPSLPAYSESESCSVVSDSLWPRGLYSPWNSPGQNTGVGSCSLLQGIFPHPGIKHRSPTLQANSLPGEPPGKPKNTGVGSLSLLQQIFLTQESNWGLLLCRWILYQLSYGGNPLPAFYFLDLRIFFSPVLPVTTFKLWSPFQIF